MDTLELVVSIEEAVKYMRYEMDDIDEEQAEGITNLIMAAQIYLKNAGCVLTKEDEMAKLAVKMLVVHWDENREPIGETNKLAYGLQSLITQLQYCY